MTKNEPKTNLGRTEKPILSPRGKKVSNYTSLNLISPSLPQERALDRESENQDSNRGSASTCMVLITKLNILYSRFLHLHVIRWLRLNFKIYELCFVFFVLYKYISIHL